MKKLQFFGLLAVALALELVLAGCASTGGTSSTTQFEGTWRQQNGDQYNTYTFTSNKMLYKGGTISRPGTFTFTDTAITFIPAQANTWEGWTQGYTLTADTLTLADDGSTRHPNGRFDKQ
jgi:hypothetical protein